MTENILIYFAAINGLTLVLSIVDKGLAVHRCRRIPERFLLTLSFAGGAAAAKFAQILTGHKTLKVDFTASLSLIAFLQLGVAAAIWSEQMRLEDLPVYQRLASKYGPEPTEDVQYVAKESSQPRRFGPGS